MVIYLLYVKLLETIHINRLPDGRHLFLLNKAEKSRYFHVLAHESAHATKHVSRLDRHHSGKTKAQRHAQEEIVAEISSSMICARLGVQPSFDQNAAYLHHWIDVLKSDNRAIVKAASMAQAAADWMFETAGEPDRSQAGLLDQSHRRAA